MCGVENISVGSSLIEKGTKEKLVEVTVIIDFTRVRDPVGRVGRSAFPGYVCPGEEMWRNLCRCTGGVKVAIKVGRKAAEGTCWTHVGGVVQSFGWVRP